MWNWLPPKHFLPREFQSSSHGIEPTGKLFPWRRIRLKVCVSQLPITPEIKSKDPTTAYMAPQNLPLPISLTSLPPFVPLFISPGSPWPSCCSLSMPSLLLPQGICTCYSCYLNTTSLPVIHWHLPHSIPLKWFLSRLLWPLVWNGVSIPIYPFMLLQSSSWHLSGLILFSSWFIYLWPASYCWPEYKDSFSFIQCCVIPCALDTAKHKLGASWGFGNPSYSRVVLFPLNLMVFSFYFCINSPNSLCLGLREGKLLCCLQLSLL